MKLNLVMLFISLFSLMSCAHENDGDINLENINTVELKTLFDFEFSGYNSEGNELTASISMVNEKNALGVDENYITRTLAIHIVELGEDTILEKYSLYSTEADYFGFLQNTGEICQNDSPDSLPDTVSIGDTGTLSSLDCLGVSTQDRSWLVEATNRGNSKVTIKMEETPRRSSTYITSMSYLLGTEGGIIGFAINFYLTKYVLDISQDPIIASEILYTLESKNI